MKELVSITREAHGTAAKECGNAAVRWLNQAKNTIGDKIIWLGTEIKALVLTNAWATGAIGVAAGVGLAVGARKFRRWNKERKIEKYRGGGGHSSGGH